ncbi:hypothetical protein [Chitinophaga sp. CF418]|uniref:hypothetical protein n=1 Tax=Chitinophaga sp. CF418 TaxID=1855287 RepID=UPI000923F266|nr:hypothetical protein [Chitinophaga sp. CF418]SHN46171.1 hypothetical protein SAMN05216311_1241 [Chitinophaga sp. CF418]
MVKYIILLFAVILQDRKEAEFQKITLFDGRLVFTIPKNMKEDRAATYFRDNFKYSKYFLTKDSTLEVQMKVHYEQYIQLRSYMKSEKEELLFRASGIDKKITKEEVRFTKKRTVLLISCEFTRPGTRLEKYIAKRVVFNTSAGLVGLNMFYGYNTKEEKVVGDHVFERIIEGIEMR